LSSTVADTLHPALRSARLKVYLRVMPLLFLCYIIAYVDRNNVGIARLTMSKDMPAFDDAVLGFGAGIFFWGYFLLEIPGSILVERWSARKWICRIMVTWGILAAMTAFVKTPTQFYIVRFCLGLAEAGFFPGVIVYLTHWFPARDRGRAISMFLIASPLAMIVGNGISNLLLPIGTGDVPPVLGLAGWQWIFIGWGIPAVVMGCVVLLCLTDRPRQARWLSPEERDALEDTLARDRAAHHSRRHGSILAGLANPRVWLLAIAYFGVVTANYGMEIFLPSILHQWYGDQLRPQDVALVVMIPSAMVILGQLANGWSSDYFHERYFHAIVPIVIGASALMCAPLTQGNLVLTVVCFTVAATGMKSYMPAFWSLPSSFLTATAAASSVGLINSVGNLGGFLGPYVLGTFKQGSGSYVTGLYFIATTSLISSGIVLTMKLLGSAREEPRNTTSDQLLPAAVTVALDEAAGLIEPPDASSNPYAPPSSRP
jgi:MFS transporter, ACS family, tartrate transporter